MKAIPATTTSPKATLQSANANPTSRDSLATYFQEMSSSDLLTADSEAQLAALLREQEEAVWQHLLSFAPLTNGLTRFIEAGLDNKKPVNFRGVRSAATRVCNTPSQSNQTTLKNKASVVATELRASDPDQDILALVMRQLQTIKQGEVSVLDGKAHSYSEAEFQQYHSELLRLHRESTHSRNQFVRSNLGLVVSVARRYRFSGMGLADLIQEGNFGLLKAVTRFDERLGFRFSTYATWWIRHAVGRSVADKSRTVRIPVHVTEASVKIKKVTQELRAQLGREPVREEVAAQLGMSVAKLERTMHSATTKDLSLDAPMSEESDRERIEFFDVDDSDSVFEQLSFSGLSKRANLALGHVLAPLEIEILEHRYGLAGKQASTLQDIAGIIGKSRERIRQIQEKALAKLRTHLVAERAV